MCQLSWASSLRPHISCTVSSACQWLCRAVRSSLEEGLRSWCYQSITFLPHLRNTGTKQWNSRAVALNGLKVIFQKEVTLQQRMILEHLRARCWTKYSKRCKFLLNLSPPRRTRGCSDISYTSKILIMFMNFNRGHLFAVCLSKPRFLCFLQTHS